jgi:multiple sugar transport system ATP-binding protein
MSKIELRNITKKFKEVTALKDVSLTIEDGEFFVLLGPTGAGKTTSLRVVAGLERQYEGSVLFDDEPVETLTPAERDVAFVFQQYSLYPNMTVYDNLAFPLRSPLHRKPENEIKARIQDVAEKLHITHLMERKTARLSGGEMQRVSIGRAIVRQPRVYLMDEPLSNLDAKLREALRIELEHLQRVQKSTTLFVTHDQVEALTMADRIGILDNGHILQIGTPHDIYDRPSTTFVATLVGTPQINLFRASRENGRFQVADASLHIDVPSDRGVPQDILIGVRPEDILISDTGSFDGVVALTEPLGVETVIHIKTGNSNLLSVIPGISPFRINDQIKFDIARDRLHLFDIQGKRITLV